MKSWNSSARYAAVPVFLVAAMHSVASADDSAVSPANESSHPLSRTLDYSESCLDHIRDNIQDYSCRLIKRERIGEKMQDMEYANLIVRCELRQGEEIVQPLSLFMRVYAPPGSKDRRVLYVAGQKGGKMRVRRGGTGMLKFLKLTVDLNGALARRESNYPVTDVVLSNSVNRLIRQAKKDINIDPDGTNTEVTWIDNVVYEKRDCTHITIVHPTHDDRYEYHVASWYFDNELQVPIRLVMYDWPEAEGEKPLLVEEYTYADLKLNVGLTDTHFHESRLN